MSKLKDTFLMIYLMDSAKRDVEMEVLLMVILKTGLFLAKELLIIEMEINIKEVSIIICLMVKEYYILKTGANMMASLKTVLVMDLVSKLQLMVKYLKENELMGN
mmetsp:Transcript_25481/g.4227  ORF Transcript_25481/g.4227 Transcript_25481/m.4227 type:complete len:105 (+) Transcript_25481:818-1132(+)